MRRIFEMYVDGDGLRTITHRLNAEACPRRGHGFQRHYERVAKPFEWKFTRRDLRRVLSKLDEHELEREYREAA